LSQSKGKSADEYLRTLIEAELLSQQTFAEILAPIREGFRNSGLTEEQLERSLSKPVRRFTKKNRPTKNEQVIVPIATRLI
jgi:hypothetical protein